MSSLVRTHTVPDQRTLRVRPRKAPKIDLSAQAFRGTVSEFVERFLTVDGKAFSFARREYLRPIYDRSYPESQRTILRTGRQVEKCAQVSVSQVLTSNGSQKNIEDLKVGDEVVSYDSNFKKTTDRVVGVYDNGTQITYKVTTRLNHVIYVTGGHRLWQLYGYEELSSLRSGEMVASVRSGGEFTGTCDSSDAEIRYVAYMIGDGCLRMGRGKSTEHSFTNNKKIVMDDFERCLRHIDPLVQIRRYRDDQIDCRYRSEVSRNLFEELGLWGLGSQHKQIPVKYFDLDRRKTASFLNALWATDGHVAKTTSCKYDIEYSSINYQLVKQVQNLLYKFGIPSVIRSFVPTLYRGTEKRGYSVRIITQQGVRTFLTEIGALGKSEGVPLPDAKCNNNRDSIPREIVSYLKSICPSRKGQGFGRTSLFRNGLRLSPKYHLTYDKARAYISFFESEGIDCSLLKDLVSSDVIWDQIDSIECVGEQRVYDIETARHHNFVVDGIVTHNSTSLATKMLALCAQVPFFRSIYVSPSQMQSRQFSSDRVTANALRSPRVRKMFKGPGTSNQVFDKKLINGAAMYFRYAFLNPDRCRGISGDDLNIDEIQDILVDNIPVIRECLSHSEYKLETYSGTPKTTSNAIEFYWEKSTQNTWLVKCRRCGYYSKLDMSVLGDKYMMCARCHRPIYAIDGQWVRMNSRGNWEGFSIPQLMVPWLAYTEIIQKLKDYSTAKFYNEVLGLPYDSGVKPVTEAMLRAICTAGAMLQDPSDFIRGFPVFAGLDWGSGEPNEDGQCSFTVMSLGAMLRPGRLTIFRMRRFTGPDADLLTIATKIGQEFSRFGMALTVGDWGYGHALNGQLRDAWGVERVMESEYVTQNVPIKYDPATWRLKVDRTQTMSQFIRAIKRGEVEFFDWDQFETFGQDFKNIDAEYNDKRNKIVYTHRPDAPDDSFHSALYCWLAFKSYYKTLSGMP